MMSGSERLAWQKSSFSGGGNGDCVEVASGPKGLIHLRESDCPEGVVTTTASRLAAFLGGVKAGAYDDLAR